MRVLGIETSCDETSAAIVEGGFKMRSNVIKSQMDHAAYGGVVPELASRAHITAVVPVVGQALEEAGIEWDEISGIAVTQGPGLVGSLLVGISFAKALAMSTGKPLIGINHMEGHIFSTLIENQLSPPFLTLLVSGGHTELVLVEALGIYKILGRTRDDAAGEAFDKVAKILGILPNQGSVMGGKRVAEEALKGNPRAIPFPRAMIKEDSFDFSFSGLKTAVLNYVKGLDTAALNRQTSDIAASFQTAITDVLVTKTVKALEYTGLKTVALAGGVAANKELRTGLEQAVAALGGRLYCPSLALCTDNAAMIAAVGTHRLAKGQTSGYDLDADPRLSL
jgi:N6-L-threonylcarbamoyladenine synthase